MCPFCLTTVGLIVAGSVSTGGLAALVVKVSRKSKRAAGMIANHSEGSTSNVSKRD